MTVEEVVDSVYSKFAAGDVVRYERVNGRRFCWNHQR